VVRVSDINSGLLQQHYQFFIEAQTEFMLRYEGHQPK
jgi:hypothetical protein